jgi:hypothetical protein
MGKKKVLFYENIMEKKHGEPHSQSRKGGKSVFGKIVQTMET